MMKSLSSDSLAAPSGENGVGALHAKRGRSPGAWMATDPMETPMRDLQSVPDMQAEAIIFEGGHKVRCGQLALNAPGADDLVIDVEYSGISTGTERLLWSGDMPVFPGMQYPLVPGYEASGKVIWSENHPDLIGKTVFVPGARCYRDVQGLFGASASRLVVSRDRAVLVPTLKSDEAILLALAATADHAIAGGRAPDLIVGHGVLGRLIARISLALGNEPPVVWEINPERQDANRYPVIDPELDGRSDYQSIYDVSGDASLINTLIGHLAPRGEIVLAGFYAAPISFEFPAAFMREARLRVAAEWKPEDIDAVLRLLASGKLVFERLITHRVSHGDAAQAYQTAFEDPACLKMILNWKDAA